MIKMFVTWIDFSSKGGEPKEQHGEIVAFTEGDAIVLVDDRLVAVAPGRLTVSHINRHD